MVLGMDADQGAMLARRQHQIEQRLVVDLDQIIGHEDLDRGVALPDQLGQVLLDRLLVGIGDDHVESVIDQRAALRQRGIVVDDLSQIEPAMLGGEGDQRCVAPEGGRGRGAFE